MKPSSLTFQLTVITAILLIIGFAVVQAQRKVWKQAVVISRFGSNTLAFGCAQVIITNYTSSNGSEQLAIRMEGEITLTNLIYLVQQERPAVIIFDTHPRALISNAVHQGKTSGTPGWNWTMMSRKARVVLLLPVDNGYQVRRMSCSYFWTDY